MPELTWDLLDPHIHRLEVMLRLYRPDQPFQPILAASVDYSEWVDLFSQAGEQLLTDLESSCDQPSQAVDLCTTLGSLATEAAEPWRAVFKEPTAAANKQAANAGGTPRNAARAWRHARETLSRMTREPWEGNTLEPLKGDSWLGSSDWHKCIEHFQRDTPTGGAHAVLPQETLTAWAHENAEIDRLLNIDEGPLSASLLTLLRDQVLKQVTCPPKDEVRDFLARFKNQSPGRPSRKNTFPSVIPTWRGSPTVDDDPAWWRFIDQLVRPCIGAALLEKLPGERFRSRRQELKKQIDSHLTCCGELLFLCSGYRNLFQQSRLMVTIAASDLIDKIKREFSVETNLMPASSTFLEDIRTLPSSLLKRHVIDSWRPACRRPELLELLTCSLAHMCRGSSWVTETNLAEEQDASVPLGESARKRSTATAKDLGRRFQELRQAQLAFHQAGRWRHWRDGYSDRTSGYRKDRGWTANPLALLLNPVAEKFDAVVSPPKKRLRASSD